MKKSAKPIMLEVGMRLYDRDGRGRVTISRVTAKRAYVEWGEKEIEFDRECADSKCIYRRGADSWSREAFYFETPELVKNYQRYCLVKQFKKIQVEELSNKQLMKILEIVREASKETSDENTTIST